MIFTGSKFLLVILFTGVIFSPVPPLTCVPRRILLVDDNPLVRDSIRRVLQFDGHNVEIATNGEEALAVFRKCSFDLIVTDYDMPEMTGGQLAAAIKAILPLQPILMISAHGDELRSDSRAHPAVDAIITKPFRIEQLRQAISNLPVNPSGIVSTPLGPAPTQSRLRS